MAARFDNQGWLSGAIRCPGPGNKTSGLRSSTKGIVMHSAVGYWPGMKSVLDGSSRQVSWHFSNLRDGTLYQHYPVDTKCWHARGGNSTLAGMEQEGGASPRYSQPLTDKQIDNCATVAAALRGHYGWGKLSRTGAKKNLWEHNEVQGSSTACPSDRIPWPEVQRRALTPPIEEEDDMANLVILHGEDRPGTYYLSTWMVRRKLDNVSELNWYRALQIAEAKIPQVRLDEIPFQCSQ